MKYIFANWKSNKNLAQSREWLRAVGEVDSEYEVILLPAFNLLGAIFGQVLEAGMMLGVQDLSPLAAGSYTGAISTINLEGMGVKYALVGHSERRHYFGESDRDVAGKVDMAIEAGLIPVVCVDEGYIESQATSIEQDKLIQCIVAYEPLSAIGTGDQMSPEKVEAVFARIKKAFGEVEVIYGGSVNPDNVQEYLRLGNGVLVGGVSLEADKFKQLL